MVLRCPICETIETKHESLTHQDGEAFDCTNCGNFALSRSAWAVLKATGLSELESAVLSHSVRKMCENGKRAFLTTDLINRIKNDKRLPSPAEQAENLIRWLGNNLPSPGEMILIDGEHHKAVIGASNDRGVAFILETLMDKGIIEGMRVPNGGNVTLTFDGWKEFERHKRGYTDTRKAFMAMDYGNQVLNLVFKEAFRPGADDAGFQLQRLDDNPPAGLIDSRLRVEIRTSRFLVADLTDGNPGAYWEAGFAEGLGKPVIYTCNRNVFDKEGTHFDTSHHHTVLWDPDDVGAARTGLKDTIRATLPLDARYEKED